MCRGCLRRSTSEWEALRSTGKRDTGRNRNRSSKRQSRVWWFIGGRRWQNNGWQNDGERRAFFSGFREARPRAPPVAQVSNLLAARKPQAHQPNRTPADWKSAIQQVGNLRYG